MSYNPMQSNLTLPHSSSTPPRLPTTAAPGLSHSVLTDHHPAVTASPTNSVPPGDHDRALQIWLTATSVDHFYTCIYTYFYGRGAHAISFARIALLIRIGFFTWLVTWLLVCVDYPQLKLVDKPTPVSRIVYSNCLATQVHPLAKAAFLILALAWAHALFRVRHLHRHLLNVRLFFTHVLEISDDDIHSCDWALVLSKLELLQQNHPHPSSTSIGTINRLFITNRILRRDNYMIGLFSTPYLLNLNVPLPWISDWVSPILTVPIQWAIEQCVLGILFTDPRLWIATREMYQMRRSSNADQSPPCPTSNASPLQSHLAFKLRSAFYSAALISALLIPFIPLGMIVYFIVRYGNEYYRNPTPLSSRRFTPLAIWKTRELNEMPHEHELRLARALTPAHQYLNSFPATKTAILARLLLFVLGSVASVLLGLSLVYPDTLIHLELTPDGRTPVFYLTVLGGLITLVRSFKALDTRTRPMDQDTDGFGNTVLDPVECMHRLVAETHVCPPQWDIWGFNSYRTRDEVAAMVMPKLTLYFMELIGVLVAPLVLGVSVAGKSEAIVQFVMDHTAVVPGLGCVYQAAVFDDAVFAQSQHGDDVGNETVLLELSDDDIQQPLARHADSCVKSKMTSSAFQFQQNHPLWQPPSTLASYLSRLTQAHLNRYPSPINPASPADPNNQPSLGRLFTASNYQSPSAPSAHPLHVSIYESILRSTHVGLHSGHPNIHGRFPNDSAPSSMNGSSTLSSKSSPHHPRPAFPPATPPFHSPARTGLYEPSAVRNMQQHPPQSRNTIPLLDIGHHAAPPLSLSNVDPMPLLLGAAGPGNRDSSSDGAGIHTRTWPSRPFSPNAASVSTEAMLQMVHEFYGED